MMIAWIVGGIIIGIDAKSFVGCIGASAFLGFCTVIYLMLKGLKTDGVTEFIVGLVYNSIVPLIVASIIFAVRKF